MAQFVQYSDLRCAALVDLVPDLLNDMGYPLTGLHKGKHNAIIAAFAFGRRERNNASLGVQSDKIVDQCSRFAILHCPIQNDGVEIGADDSKTCFSDGIFRRHMRKVEMVAGLLLAATGTLMILGSFERIAIFLLETFPVLATFG